jgi:hypothetical protein
MGKTVLLLLVLVNVTGKGAHPSTVLVSNMAVGRRIESKACFM